MKGNLVMKSLSKCLKKNLLSWICRLRHESSVFKSHLYLVDIISDIVHV